MHKDLIIFKERSIFFCFGCIRRSFKDLWPKIFTSIYPTDEKSDKSGFFSPVQGRRFDLLPNQVFTYFDIDDECFKLSWLKNAVNSPFLICVQYMMYIIVRTNSDEFCLCSINYCWPILGYVYIGWCHPWIIFCSIKQLDKVWNNSWI